MSTGSRQSRLRIMALVVLVVLATTQVAMGALTWDERNLTDRADDQDFPAIWGDTIVYEDYDTPDGEADVVMYDLVTGTESTLVAQPGAQYDPEIYGDRIVWRDRRGGPYYDVYAYDISHETEMLIAGGPLDETMPRTHGTKVVWSDSREVTATGMDIYMYDFCTGEETALVTDPGEQNYPSVWGQRVAYEDYGTPSSQSDIKLLDLVTRDTVKVTDEVSDPLFSDRDYDPRVWFNWVAWSHDTTPAASQNWDILAYNVDTEDTVEVATGPTQQVLPYIWGGLITWEGDSDETTTTNDIFAYEISSGETATVVAAPHNQWEVAHWGNKVVWADGRDGGATDIWIGISPLEGDRAAGLTRYQTAVEASKSHFSSARTVVLATGADFADALAASGLAGCLEAPLLLTLPSELHPDAKAEIERLDATEVIIVGGTGAVSAGVANALTADGLTVRRLGGLDRYETAALIARETADIMGTQFPKVAFLARGDVFADALAVSPIAYYNHFPILLTRPNSMPDSTKDVLADLRIEGGFVAGGSGAISEAVQDEFDALLTGPGGGTLSERWAGVDRYETAEMVAGAATERNLAGRGFVGLAVGDNFPDALAGGVAAGQEFGVILLTRTTTLSPNAATFLGDSGDGIGWLQAFGGTGVITDAVLQDAVAAAD